MILKKPFTNMSKTAKLPQEHYVISYYHISLLKEYINFLNYLCLALVGLNLLKKCNEINQMLCRLISV